MQKGGGSCCVTGGLTCGPNQYQDGNQCYDKQQRMGTFNRTQYLDNQTNKSNDYAQRPSAATLSMTKGTTSSIDDANPLPQAPQTSSAKSTGAVEDFISNITPPDKGPIFGTSGDDVTSIKDWVDTIATIGEKTADGVVSVFKALDPFSWL